MNVRIACRADIAQILYLENEMFSDPLTKREANGMYAHADSRVWVCEWHKEICGYIFCLSDTCAAEILRIGVPRAWERRGIGKTLVLHAAQSYGDDVSLEMHTGNKELKGFLMKLNFTIVADFGGAQLYRRGWRFSRPPQLKYRLTQ